MKFKRPLVLVLVLALAMSAVTGGTIAWFTDEVTSEKNIITAGNLDIELYTDNGTQKVDENTQLFLDANNEAMLWEPGAVAYENLTIKNEGTLHLIYDLDANISNENTVIAADGTPTNYKLSDVLKVAVVEGGVSGDRDAILAQAKGVTARKLGEAWAANATLAPKNEANAETTLGVVVYWEPSADDNNWNVNNGKTVSNFNNAPATALQIDLGVKLSATQLAAEEDAFGPDYDADAWESWEAVAEVLTPDANGVVNVSTAKQLAGVMTNTSGIKTINILKDINLDGRTWIPAFVTAPDLVINGNGHVISNMTTGGASNVGFIGAAYQNITIKDLTFKNAKVEATGSFVGGVIGNGWGGNAITLDNVDLVDSEVSTSIPTKAIRLGGLIGYSPYNRGNLTLKDCDVTGSTFAGYHNVGAMVGTMMFYGPEQGTITIENCTAKKNTLKYGSPKVGAFDFGASVDGYTAYVPASGFTAEDNKTVAIVNVNADLNALINQGATEIELPAGEYTFPSNSSFTGDETLICEEGTVFTGTSNLNINGATVKGATFSNPDGQAVSGTINGVFEDCTFNGNEALRWCYNKAGDTTKFVNCVIENDFRGVHFDTLEGEVVFEGCTLTGFNAFGGTGKVAFTNCKFVPGSGSYNGVNLYCDADFTDCTFVFDNSKSEFVDCEGTGKTVTFTNCVVSDGTNTTSMQDSGKVGGSTLEQNTIIYK